jgi:hypothetical protein
MECKEETVGEEKKPQYNFLVFRGCGSLNNDGI